MGDITQAADLDEKTRGYIEQLSRIRIRQIMRLQVTVEDKDTELKNEKLSALLIEVNLMEGH